jgi:hypothetical protein
MHCTVHMLAHGVAGDLVVEHILIGKSTCLEALYMFCKEVVAMLGGHYLRGPNAEDMARFMASGNSMGFSGLLGSISCMN